MIEIKLSLPDHLYQHAKNLSATTHLEIPNILIDALAFTLPTFDGALAAAAPAKQLENGTNQASPGLPAALEKINAPEIDEEYLSGLLFQHRESEVTVAEAAHAFSLMLMYHHRWLRRNGCHQIAAMLEMEPGQLGP
jgi:hypothetical protein